MSDDLTVEAYNGDIPGNLAYQENHTPLDLRKYFESYQPVTGPFDIRPGDAAAISDVNELTCGSPPEVNVWNHFPPLTDSDNVSSEDGV